MHRSVLTKRPRWSASVHAGGPSVALIFSLINFTYSFRSANCITPLVHFVFVPGHFFCISAVYFDYTTLLEFRVIIFARNLLAVVFVFVNVCLVVLVPTDAEVENVTVVRLLGGLVRPHGPARPRGPTLVTLNIGLTGTVCHYNDFIADQRAPGPLCRDEVCRLPSDPIRL